MSYDLTIIGSKALPRDELIDAIRSTECFDVANQTNSGDDVLTVVVGAERDYVCSVAGPYGVEPDDVSVDVAAVVGSPRFMYTMAVEGSMPTAVEAAVRLARRLAVVVEGATTDDQTGEIWSRGQRRRMSKVQPGAAVDIVQLRWHVLRAQASSDIARRYVDLCVRYLPEALPKRYGSDEPLQGKWSDGEKAAFIQAAQHDDETLYFVSTRPCFGGSLASTAGSSGDTVITHKLSIERGALYDPPLRNNLRSLFVEFAAQPGCFFALAEVVRGLMYDGRELSYAATTERTVSLARGVVGMACRRTRSGGRGTPGSTRKW